MTAAREGAPADVPPPEPLPAEALDSHCHLEMVERPVGEFLAAARAANITRVVTIGTDLATSRWAVDAAYGHAGLYAAVAVHPNETAAAASSPEQRTEVLAQIAELALLERVRAIGETGLDSTGTTPARWCSGSGSARTSRSPSRHARRW